MSLIYKRLQDLLGIHKVGMNIPIPVSNTSTEPAIIGLFPKNFQ